MRIIKKNGTTDNYDIQKTITSIVNSAFDINFLITRADINILSKDIMDILTSLHGDNDITSSYEVKGIVLHVLYRDGFGEVAKSYMNAE